MLRNVNNLIGYSIRALDGELGKVNEFYFDDFTWSIRYLVVDTGNWLSGRKVLIPHRALGTTDWNSKTFQVNLTMDQVSKSPDIDTKKTVSRQQEEKLFGHYSLPIYWGEGIYGSPLGMLPITTIIDMEKVAVKNDSSKRHNEDPHLRGTIEVKGYHIHANDGEIGHVADFIVDDDKWNLCYFIVDTHNWLPGRKVVIMLRWIDHIDWSESKVYVDVSQESIKTSPEFDTTQPISKDYETELFNYYNKHRNKDLV